MTPRRALYMLRYYPTLTETFVYREIAELGSRGLEVGVATFGPRGDGGIQGPLPGVESRRPPRAPLYLRLLPGLLSTLLRPRAWAVLRWLLARLRLKDAVKALWIARQARRWPVVHVHFAGEAAEWAWAARRLYGVPYTVTVHANDLFRPRASLGQVLGEASAVLTISRFNADLIEERLGVRARVVPCGVAPSPHRARGGGDPPVIVAVGRWVPKKGLDLLVEAVEGCALPARLVLVSDAPAHLASPRVRVAGLLPPREVEEALLEADLFALPCRRAEDGDMDGIPVALMEAMAVGLPVITTRLGGVPELVDEEVGWLVPPGDGEALMQALEEALRDPTERRRRGGRGPERLQERGFTVESQVDGLLDAWRSTGLGR